MSSKDLPATANQRAYLARLWEQLEHAGRPVLNLYPLHTMNRLQAACAIDDALDQLSRERAA